MPEKQPTTEQPYACMPEQGLRVEASDPRRLQAALVAARNYRGDVTIVRRSNGRAIVGFVFDVAHDSAAGSAVVRLFPADDGGRIVIVSDEIAVIEFTGPDASAGRSFEAWVEKHLQSKRKGEPGGIEPEPLDGE